MEQTQRSLPGVTIPHWTIGDRLRKARQHAGYDQAEMASLIGISVRSITNYELENTSPKRPVLLSWAMATGVPLTWLISGEAPPEPRPSDSGHVAGAGTGTGDQENSVTDGNVGTVTRLDQHRTTRTDEIAA